MESWNSIKKREVILTAKAADNDLYLINSIAEVVNNNPAADLADKNMSKLIHNRLGHLNYSEMKWMIINNSLLDLKIQKLSKQIFKMDCIPCKLAKQNDLHSQVIHQEGMKLRHILFIVTL